MEDWYDIFFKNTVNWNKISENRSNKIKEKIKLTHSLNF